MHRTPNLRFAGFSLIELMIAVAIIGILAMIALPSYESYVQRTRRADAKTELSSLAQRLERCFSQFGTYLTGTGCSVGNGPFTTPEGYYSIAISNRTQTTYTLTATRQGAQTKDSKCGNFTLNHLGVRGATGTLGSACWDS
jgi:type IV pilus assembly protein PilE